MKFEVGDVVRNKKIDDKIWCLGEVRAIDEKRGEVFVAMFRGHDSWKVDDCELEVRPTI